MTQSPLLSARLQNVLNQLEKIIAELDGDGGTACDCTCGNNDFLTR